MDKKITTEKEALAALQKEGWTEIMFFPKKVLTFEVCLAAVRQVELAVEYIPPSLRAKVMNAFITPQEVISARDNFRAKGQQAMAKGNKDSAKTPGFKITSGVLKGVTSKSEEIIIPNVVKKIADEAFQSVSPKKIYIPASVKDIGEYFPHWCLFETIEVDPQNEVYSSNEGVLYDKTGKTLIRCPTFAKFSEFVIPDSVRTIGECAFMDCRWITSIHIPDSVQDIKNSVFYNCDGLISVSIPDSVKTIGEMAFQQCKGLKSAHIGTSVKSIGSGVFSNCGNLKKIEVSEQNKAYSVKDGALYDQKTGKKI